MAINKVINRGTKSKAGMRNLLEYVLRDEKVKEGYIEIIGPYTENEIEYEHIYQEWIYEKQLWNKESGRMYSHNIISFHPDENVSPEEVLEIGKEFNDRFFSGHQSLIAVHQDKDHLHCHIVTNSVSYVDGSKLHQTKKDLEMQKGYTNALCEERGLSIAKKGKHCDGTDIAKGEVISWDKNTYKVLSDDKDSHLVDCACSVTAALRVSHTRDEFISEMDNRGWDVQWDDAHTHIVFTDEDGHKVRDSKLNKLFAMDISKDELGKKLDTLEDEQHSISLSH